MMYPLLCSIFPRLFYLFVLFLSLIKQYETFVMYIAGLIYYRKLCGSGENTLFRSNELLLDFLTRFREN